MKPPKCKSCGKEEWRHTCGAPIPIILTRLHHADLAGTITDDDAKVEVPMTFGGSVRAPRCADTTTTKARNSSPRKNAPKSLSALEQCVVPHGTPASPINAESVTGGTSEISTSTKPKTDRKVYLKLKARERRAAEKLGITVKEYRERGK